MPSKNKLINIISMSLVVVLLALALTVTLIAIFFPDVLISGFDWSGYDSKYDASGTIPNMNDLNNLTGSGGSGGSGGGGGGGSIDLSRVIFRVYSTKTAKNVYFRQGSYVTCEGNQWFEAEPFVSKYYPDISATYFSGQYILESAKAAERSIYIESLDGTVVMPYYATGGLDVPETVYPYGEENYTYTVNYVDYKEVLRLQDMAIFADEYEAYVKKTYLELTPETEAYMRKIIQEQGFKKYASDVVEKVAAYISSAKKYDMNFDPALEEEENIPVAFLEEYDSGVCRHFAASATMLFRALGIPARYTVGFLGDTAAMEWTDVTAAQAHAWVEIFVRGFGWMPVEVTPSSGDSPPDDKISIQIKPEDIEVQGGRDTVLICERIEGFEYYESLGYTYEVEISGEQRGYGKTQTNITKIRLYDEYGEDVTDTFNIDVDPGYLHVYYSVLQYSSESSTHVYDGNIFTYEVYHETRYNYYGKHYAKPVLLAGALNVGRVANMFLVSIMNENNEDITDHYKIEYRYGTLEVTHAEISIKAMDAEKLYDGTPLECPEYEFLENNLAAGHYIDPDIKIIGSQTERGRSDNIIDISSIIIRDAHGNDVTSNYKIKTYVGQLRVR